MANPTVADVLEVVLAEFKSLRDEINQRATYCHTLININVVASGTLAGLGLSNIERVELLMLLPILSPVLGLLWIDHSYAIRNMGDYINIELKPAVFRAFEGNLELLRWEAYLDEHERGHKVLRFLPLGIPILVMFSAVPAFALVQSFGAIGVNGQGVLWSFGCLLTLAFLGLWFRLFFAPYVQGHRVGTSSPPEKPPEVPGRV